jgi:hypothetical protein
MFNIIIKPEILAHGQFLVKHNNYGKRGINDGKKIDQLVGMVAQCSIMDLLGYELPPIITESDCGIDIEYQSTKIDIKANAYNSYPKLEYKANVFAAQKHYNTDVYIFSVVHREQRTITITGWISKAEFFNKAIFRHEGYLIQKPNKEFFALKAPDYAVEISELNQVGNLNELIKGLDEFSRTQTLR